MPHNSGKTRVSRRRRRVCAFTLIDVLVSIAVISLLIGLLLPSLSAIRETTRRVVCASNVRQIGYGLSMYADDNRDYLPATVHRSKGTSALYSSTDSMSVRLPISAQNIPPWGAGAEAFWDGIGLMYEREYLPAPKVFYCPSHKGEHPFERYAKLWRGSRYEIVCNYQYRGWGPNGEKRFSRIVPPHAALLTDGMRTIEDFNHAPGMNVLFADLSVEYLVDSAGSVTGLLPAAAKQPGPGGGGGGDAGYVDTAWDHIDELGGSN